MTDENGRPESKEKYFTKIEKEKQEKERLTRERKIDKRKKGREEKEN
jgi:hypothetical protein